MTNRQNGHGGIQLAKAVREAYRLGETDYSLEPLVRVDERGEPIGRVQAGDSVIFCCRRGEREVQLTEAFTDPGFQHFPRPSLPDLTFIPLTLYHEKFKDLPVAFMPTKVSSTLGEIASQAGLRQLRTSESEKFAHVTFFFNGGRNQPFPGEDRWHVPSPRGIAPDQAPELSLPRVVDQVLAGIAARYDLIVANFANGDVIGHTASCAAKVRCAEIVDAALGEVVRAATGASYVTLVTADHGNLEVMLTEEGAPHVAHTANPVPCILIDPYSPQAALREGGSLANIAPTILAALGIAQPGTMESSSLLPDHNWQGQRQVLLLILDGWGLGQEDGTNPIYLAQTPTWDHLLRSYPHTHLKAAGEAAGLKPGKPGNSEAGHMTIGAGRVVLQDDVRLDQALKDGSFYTNEIFSEAFAHVKARGTRLHLIGLLTEKSSHGSIDYPLALLKKAKSSGLKEVYLHLIFDGRSTEPGSAPALLDKLEGLLAGIGLGQIATGVGRGLALDRDGNYAKTRKAYEAMVSGAGNKVEWV